MLGEFRTQPKENKYIHSYVTSNGFIFLQETHSSTNDEIKSEDKFKDELFF